LRFWTSGSSNPTASAYRGGDPRPKHISPHTWQYGRLSMPTGFHIRASAFRLVPPAPCQKQSGWLAGPGSCCLCLHLHRTGTARHGAARRGGSQKITALPTPDSKGHRSRGSRPIRSDRSPARRRGSATCGGSLASVHPQKSLTRSCA
jgi:hypothetical protein